MGNSIETVQVMRVGNGVLMAFHRPMDQKEAQAVRDRWREMFEDVPIAFIADARIIERDGQPLLIDFGAEVESDAFDEFKRWWEEVSHDG